MTTDNHKPMPDDATAQEVFDAIVTRMVAQGRQSVDKNGDCAYAGQDGLACAAGCIIPRDLCDRIEGQTILSVGSLPIFSGKVPAVIKRHLLLIRGLQWSHDHAESDFISEFCALARQCAKEHGLTFPEVTT